MVAASVGLQWLVITEAGALHPCTVNVIRALQLFRHFMCEGHPSFRFLAISTVETILGRDKPTPSSAFLYALFLDIGPDTMRGQLSLTRATHRPFYRIRPAYVCLQCRAIQISAAPTTESPRTGNDAFGVTRDAAGMLLD